jgi:hypothetical protein
MSAAFALDPLALPERTAAPTRPRLQLVPTGPDVVGRPVRISRRGRVARTVGALLVASALAWTGVAALAAGVAFLSLAAWPAISWRRRTSVAPVSSADPGGPAANRDPSSENPGTSTAAIPFRPGVALVAAGALLAGLGWFFAELLRDGDRIGLSERAAAGSQALWPLAAVLLARREQRR